MRTYQIIKNGNVEVITAEKLCSAEYKKCIIVTDSNRHQFQKQITQFEREQKLNLLGI